MAPAFAFFAACCWGTSAILVRLGLQHMRSTTGTFLSLSVSFVLIMVLTLVLDIDSLVAIPAIAFGWIALQGVLNFVVGRFLNMTGVSLAGASRVTPIVAVSPLFAATFAFFFLGERPTPPLIAGTLCIVAAIVLIVSQGLRDAGQQVGGGKGVLIGCLLALCAALGYGANNVVSKEVVTNYTTPLVASSMALLFGAIYLFPMAFRSLPELVRVPRREVGFIALSGIGQGLGVASMMTALSKAPVVVVSPIGSMNPLIALVLAHLFLGRMERITPRIVVGTLLAISGVALVILGRNL